LDALICDCDVLGKWLYERGRFKRIFAKRLALNKVAGDNRTIPSYCLTIKGDKREWLEDDDRRSCDDGELLRRFIAGVRGHHVYPQSL
jgi:hypothetical protein